MLLMLRFCALNLLRPREPGGTGVGPGPIGPGPVGCYRFGRHRFQMAIAVAESAGPTGPMYNSVPIR